MELFVSLIFWGIKTFFKIIQYLVVQKKLKTLLPDNVKKEYMDIFKFNDEKRKEMSKKVISKIDFILKNNFNSI
jgi:hypothetical protein